jgi:hypothetical protein
MLDEFMDTINSPEFDEEGWIDIKGVEAVGINDLIVHLCLATGHECDESWSIRCIPILDSRIITGGDHGFVCLESEHVVLWNVTQPYEELYINSRPEYPVCVFGALVEAHLQAAGNWFPIDKFLNLPGRSNDILCGGHGLIARAPAPIIEVYCKVLDEYQVKHSKLAGRGPKVKYLGNGKLLAEDLRALILGDSYIVSSDFQGSRV